MPPLDHILHALLCLLQIIGQHIAVQLVLPQALIVFLAGGLDPLIRSLRRFDRRVHSRAPRLARRRRQRDLDGQRVRGVGGEGREGVWRRGDGGGYGFDVLRAVPLATLPTDIVQ
jgi:hypothetical protein